MLVRSEGWKKCRALRRSYNVKIKVYKFYNMSGHKHIKFLRVSNSRKMLRNNAGYSQRNFKIIIIC